MRPFMQLLLTLLLATFAVPADAAPTKSKSKSSAKTRAARGFAFVTAWSGKAGKIVFDVRHRSDGTTVVRYRGQRTLGKKTTSFEGNFRGKVTSKNRTVKSSSGYVTVPRVGPTSTSKPGSGTALFWGGATDGFDFSVSVKGFDVPLVGFDVPLVGFDVPLVGFDKVENLRNVAVSTLGGGLNGIAVARTVGGKTAVTFATKTGGQLKTGSLDGKTKSSLSLSRGDQRFTGRFADAKRKVGVLTGALRVKVGKSWRVSAAQFTPASSGWPGSDW